MNFSSWGAQPRFAQSAGPWSGCTRPGVSVGLEHRGPAVLALHPLQTLSPGSSRCVLLPPLHWSSRGQHCCLPSSLPAGIPSQPLTSTVSSHSRRLSLPHVSWGGCPAVPMDIHCRRNARGVTSHCRPLLPAPPSWPQSHRILFCRLIVKTCPLIALDLGLQLVTCERAESGHSVCLAWGLGILFRSFDVARACSSPRVCPPFL